FSSLYCFFFPRYTHHPALHSFPTRRSSDLTLRASQPKRKSVISADWGINYFHFPKTARYIVAFSSKSPFETFSALDLLTLGGGRSEEHTSELQSRGHLVCRLLLEKKKK